VPIFNKFHRVVRDAAMVESKNVVLKLEGTDTEIDRNILQVMSDSLIHLIRNAVAHGIETPEVRKGLGKPREGTVWLSAQNSTDAVVIEIRDDGAGLDFERIRSKAVAKGLVSHEMADKLSHDEISLLIFEPGFSTMDRVTAMSGRGVGMDVVKTTLESIGGTVKILSEPGKGTTMSLTMPASMAVKSCLLLELQEEVYAIPLSFTESVMSLYKADIFKAGGGLVASHLGKNIPVVFLEDIFSLEKSRAKSGNHLQHTFDATHPEERLEIVVVTYNNRTVGFVVDKLLQQKEIVEKPLMKPVDKVRFIGGVTILGNGKVCLVLNVPFILNYIFTISLQGRSSTNLSIN
jgi:two-component system chemotaxis sensor kinase CheA